LSKEEESWCHGLEACRKRRGAGFMDLRLVKRGGELVSWT